MTQIASQPPTFESVWAMFQETREQFRAMVTEMALQSKETDRQMKETDRKIQETDRIVQENALQMKETDRKIQETDQIVKNLSKQFGDLGNRLGEFVEHMVSPALIRLFQAQGLEVHEVYHNVTSRRKGALEIDLLVVNEKTLVAVECKSKLVERHVDEHVARMDKIKQFLPLYAGHRALGALAAMVMDESVKAYAQSKGFYVLCQNGEGIELSNSANFQPRAW